MGERLSLNHEQEQAYGQIAGFFGRAEREFPAAAVAYERRAEILSSKMTKDQYADLVKRVLAAGKI